MPLHKTLIPTLLPAILTLLLLARAHAQYGAPKVAAVTATAQPVTIAPGGKGLLLVTVTVGPQYHINADKPNDPAYIPTQFTGQTSPGITFAPAKYPTPKAIKVSYSPKPLLVYVGKAVIAVPFTVAKTAKPGRITLAGTVAFQGCDAKSCYPPTSAPVRTVVTVK